MIIILGNSYFGPKLAKSLSSLNKEKVIYCDTSTSKSNQIKYLACLPFARVVYSISGSIKNGGALKLALLLRKKIYQHFIGSDVTEAIDDYANKNYSEQLIAESKYFSEIEWVNNEIVGNLPIKSEVVELPILENDNRSRVTSKKCHSSIEVKVLTYIGQGKEEFYGIRELLAVANIRKDILFTIVGSSCEGYNLNELPNITCLGWVDNIKEVMSEHDIYFRYTIHDGLPFSVVEALSLGKFVIYNHNMPHCFVVHNTEDILESVSKAEILLDSGSVNIDGYEFVFEKYTEEKAASHIYSKLI